MGQPRNISYDLLKVSALLSITFFHVWRFIGKPTLDIYLDPWEICRRGFIGVEICLVVTIFLINSRIQKNSNDILKTYSGIWKGFATNFYPQYVVAVGVWNLLLIYGVTNKSHNIWDNITHLTMTHTLFEQTFFKVSGTLWYAGVYAQVLILVPILLFVFHAIKNPVLRIIMLLFMLLSGFVSNYYGTSRILTWSVLSYMPLVSFCIICEFVQTSIKDRYKYILGLGTLLSCLCIFYSKPSFLKQELYDMMVAALFVFSVVSFEPLLKRLNDSIKSILLHVSSLSILLFFYNYIFYAAKKAEHSGIVGLLIYSVFVYVFCFLFGFIYNKLANVVIAIGNSHRKYGKV
ncbi:hypothetical protein [Maridesulfovibrio bastinii]|uniref:hypothetical protein n=1 Tax=Maridesulfovibrio bastinii TaxID=47157 RepID=UPI0003FAFBAB|nr:hypothetical protein [Maridesulfovibrio bastinii]